MRACCYPREEKGKEGTEKRDLAEKETCLSFLVSPSKQFPYLFAFSFGPQADAGSQITETASA